MEQRTSPDRELMLAAVDAACEASSLDGAVLALVNVLQARLKLWRAAINSLPAGTELLRVLAAWSLVDSVFTPGTEVSTAITARVHDVMTSVREGEVVYSTMSDDPDSLVNHLLLEQGIASAVAVPLLRDDKGVLYLGLSSSEVGVLEGVGTPFFRGLAAGIAERMAELAAATRG